MIKTTGNDRDHLWNIFALTFSLRVQFGPCPLCQHKAVMGFMAYSAAGCFGRLTCRPCLFFKIGFVLKAFSQKGFALKMSNARCHYIPVVVNDQHSLHFLGRTQVKVSNWLSHSVSFRSVFTPYPFWEKATSCTKDWHERSWIWYLFIIHVQGQSVQHTTV